jgi:Ran GTPase-activating protein (RanGAP) involved in mRNA processing and transport
MKGLSRVFKNNPRIEDIQLRGAGLHSGDVSELNACLQHGALKRLDLYNNKIDGKGTVELAKILKASPNMTHLEIGSNRIEDPDLQGLTLLMKAVASHKNLKHLSFYYNYFKESEIRVIADVISSSPSLEKVDLSRGYVTCNSDSYLTLREAMFQAGRKIDIPYSFFGSLVEA